MQAGEMQDLKTGIIWMLNSACKCLNTIAKNCVLVAVLVGVHFQHCGCCSRNLL